MDSFHQRLSELFKAIPELQILKQMLTENNLEAWLVGGTLRDLLMQRTVTDIDIAVAGDPTAQAKSWAQKVGGRWFWLDAERQQSRVLLASQMTVDFAPLRADTISADQALRDFSINSLAISLTEDLSTTNLLDPLLGQQDLEEQVLQVCSDRSFLDDPLRMLKCIRHAVTLQMRLSEQTHQLVRKYVSLINNVAGERIRDELGKVLSSARPVAGLKLIYETGLLQELFGPSSITWNAEQALDELLQFEQKLKTLDSEQDQDARGEDPFSSRSLFLLATLLRSYKPVEISNLLHAKLRLSRQQQRILLSLQRPPTPQWLESVELASIPRQKALLVEQLGYFPDEQLLYWSIYAQLISLEKARDLLMSFYEHQHLARVPDLLSGHQLRELLLERREKEIGNWQKRIKTAEISGEISSQDEASSWLKSKISN